MRHSTRPILLVVGLAAAFSLGAGCRQALGLEDGAELATGEGTGGGGGSGGSGGNAGSSGEPGDGSTQTTAQEVCAQYAEDYCSRMSPCLGNEYFLMLYQDNAGCSKAETANCLATWFSPGSTFTVAQMQACNSAWASRGCYDLPPGECIPGAGTFTDGATCGSNAQCQSRACLVNTPGSCGYCTTPAAIGQTCASAPCDNGLVCEASSKFCVSIGALSDSCVAGGGTCGPGLGCVSGKCVALGLPGEACVSGADAACTQYGICNSVTTNCSFIHASAPSGALCGVRDDGEVDVCARGLVCPISSWTCQPGASVGEVCQPSADYLIGHNCGNPLVCANGKCAEPFMAKCP
jgi:hypothetical protein